MNKDTFEHLSGHFDAADVGLGWLTGVTLLTVPQALSMRPHRHPHMEAIFCLRGEFTYEIRGRKPVTVGAGMGIVIPANTIHALASSTERPGERIGLHLAKRMDRERDFAIFTPDDFALFRRTLEAMSARPFRLGPALTAAVRQLAGYLKRPVGGITSPERGFVRILCCSILYHTADTLSRPLATVEPQLMDEAVRYLEAHYAEQTRVADLVRHVGYSRARLFELFRKHTGLTPNNYLVRLRVRKAEELLKTTRMPVALVGACVGFIDGAYFGAVFRRYAGMSPAACRRQAKTSAGESARTRNAHTQDSGS